ncbi:hypothetical protein V6C39_17245 [Dickeya ananatis]
MSWRASGAIDCGGIALVTDRQRLSFLRGVSWNLSLSASTICSAMAFVACWC